MQRGPQGDATADYNTDVPPPRVRFAPSPTGFLHIGGARTALFNWLFARHAGGTFVLRIEDTDVERSSQDMVDGILDGLRWLGLDWDEGPGVEGPVGPYFQSQRLDRYRAVADQLLTTGQAYRCFCRPEDLKARREAAQAAGGGWIYDRRCRGLAPDEVDARTAAGERSAVRFFVPEGSTTFDDVVRGRIEVAHRTIEDFVILRSDGHPTYHLSVVADDAAMQISHVVRGDDHISNTPKHVLLFRALSAPVPAFAHVPLIMGPDRKRLSKRHGATAVGEYRAQGYLPEAMVNFLALLGWSPGDDRDVMTRDELVAAFALEGISGGNAIFDVEKLEWFNQQHIGRLTASEILDRAAEDLAAAGLAVPASGPERERIEHAVDLVKPRARKLRDVVDQLRPFVVDRVDRDPAAVEKHLSAPDLADHLTAWRVALDAVDPFAPEPLEAALRSLAETRGIKAGALIHATRVAVTGQRVSPGIFEVLALVGRERVNRRIDETLAALGAARS
jgi:glutamyl-tRNA synthetase